MKRRIKRLVIVLTAIALIIFVTTSILNYISGRKVEKALQEIRDKGEPLTLAEMAPPVIPSDENAAIEFEILNILFRKHDDIDYTSRNIEEDSIIFGWRKV